MDWLVEWVAAQPNSMQIMLLMIACVLLGLGGAPFVMAFARKWMGVRQHGKAENGGAGRTVHERRFDDPRWKANADEHAQLGAKVDELRKDMDGNFEKMGEKIGDTHRRIDEIFALLAKKGGSDK